MKLKSIWGKKLCPHIKFCCSFLTIFAEIEELMKVSDIAPLVAYLCHDSCTENGSIFETAGGWSAKGEEENTA